MEYSSNIVNVTQLLKEKINRTASPEATDRLQREVALAQLAAMLNRIHRDGLNTQEALIGEYSDVTIAIREAAGKSTDKVILRFSGKMFRELKIEKRGEDWLIGYPINYDSKNTYKQFINKFEEKYNGKIWGVSTSEIEMINQIIDRHIKENLA